MGIELRTTRDGVDWQAVADLLAYYGMCDYDAETAKLVFERSYAVVFAYDGEQLIGCGRALSDGISQAAVYNIALEEKYHGRKWGRAIIEALLEQVKGCSVILFTHPQTLGLYEKIGFRRLKTGMIYLETDEKDWKRIEETGFVLSEKYRFGDNEYERPDMQ